MLFTLAAIGGALLGVAAFVYNEARRIHRWHESAEELQAASARRAKPHRQHLAVPAPAPIMAASRPVARPLITLPGTPAIPVRALPPEVAAELAAVRRASRED